MFLSLEILRSIIRTGLPILVELINLVNSVIIFLSQITLIRWLTFQRGSQTVTHSPALLDLLLSSDASICSTMAFLPMGNSDDVVVSTSIDFPSNSQQDPLFLCIAYDCSRADWDGLCDHLRDVSWEDIFKLGASVAASEFCEWVQVGIDVYIPHRKYQVKSHYLHGFQLLVLLAQFIGATFFISNKRINLLILK